MLGFFSITPGRPLGPLEITHIVIWAYIVVSVLFLFIMKQTRYYPLYLLKTVWIAFTFMAFIWVVLMSCGTNQEFALRPVSVFGDIGKYPQEFYNCYHFNLWWPALLLWLPLWAAGGLTLPKSPARKRLRWGLAILSVVIGLPLILIVKHYDWSPYTHMRENYVHAWNLARMGTYFFNSILVSLGFVGLVTLLSSMAAYALTRLYFRGKEVIMAVLAGSMAIPGFLLVVPLYILMKGWTIGNFSFMDSRLGLTIIYVGTSLPFTIFLLSAFFRSLPGELAESAAIDGASPWRIFVDIYFPLAAPGLATSAIFNFLGVWNEYNFALIFLTNPDFKTLPVGLYNLQVASQFAVNWPALFAGIVLLCLPTFLTFVVLQERIVAGLTIGAVKG